MIYLIIASVFLLSGCVAIYDLLKKINKKLDYILNELLFENIKNKEYDDRDK